MYKVYEKIYMYSIVSQTSSKHSHFSQFTSALRAKIKIKISLSYCCVSTAFERIYYIYETDWMLGNSNPSKWLSKQLFQSFHPWFRGSVRLSVWKPTPIPASSKCHKAELHLLKLTSVFHHLPVSVRPKQLCALAHLGCTHEAGTS